MDAQDRHYIEQLRGWLAGEGMGHDWWVRLLLGRGQASPAAPLPADVRVMQERCCYLNAFTLATQQPERFTYLEGYASMRRSNGWGTDHAWCVDRQGHVVDPTWPNVKSDHPAAYLGLAIPLNVVAPYAVFESHGTISGWLHRYDYDDLQARLPRLLGLDAASAESDP